MHVRLAWCFRKAATSPLKRCLACPVVRFGDGFCRCDRVHPNVCFTWHWAACSLVPGVRDDLTMLFGLLNSLARCHRVSGVRIVGSVMPLRAFSYDPNRGNWRPFRSGCVARRSTATFLVAIAALFGDRRALWDRLDGKGGVWITLHLRIHLLHSLSLIHI